MLRVRQGPPVDYSLCDQVVTLYHAGFGADGGEFACARVVFRGAFFEWRENQTVDRGGSWESKSFLLVLPSGWGGRPVWTPPEEFDALEEAGRAGRFTLAPGDKVLLGEGPEAATREAWAALAPAQRQGLAAVREVEPKYWRGRVCHVEGGADKWRRRTTAPAWGVGRQV